MTSHWEWGESHLNLHWVCSLTHISSVLSVFYPLKEPRDADHAVFHGCWGLWSGWHPRWSLWSFSPIFTLLARPSEMVERGLSSLLYLGRGLELNVVSSGSWQPTRASDRAIQTVVSPAWRQRLCKAAIRGNPWRQAVFFWGTQSQLLVMWHTTHLPFQQHIECWFQNSHEKIGHYHLYPRLLRSLTQRRRPPTATRGFSKENSPTEERWGSQISPSEMKGI